MKLAHISDMHFAKPSYNPLQIFSKRFIGNMNYLLNRKNTFNHALLDALIEKFIKLHIDLVIISGDCSTTSCKKEFELTRRFINKLNKHEIEVLIIPGNHDNYTRQAFKSQKFYRSLSSLVDFESDGDLPFNLQDQKIQAKQLQKHLWLVSLDTTLYRGLIYSNGIFTPSIENNLEQLLNTIPKNDKIIIVNHFPFFQQEGKLKNLVRGEELEEFLSRHPQIILYLHGHTHRHSLADLRPTGLPVVLDSGCITNQTCSTWNQITIKDDCIEIDCYKKNSHDKQWSSFKSLNMKREKYE